MFDLVDFELDGEYIRMRAVDDLAGCASALSAMARLVRSGQQPEGDVYALFTRAEEIGLVGARLAAENGLLPASHADHLCRRVQPHACRAPSRDAGR